MHPFGPAFLIELARRLRSLWTVRDLVVWAADLCARRDDDG